jgi:predicted Ser/Thr protein kinase
MPQQFGRYEILEQLGAGSMGAVFKAHDPVMGRDVAIKTILAHAIEGPQGEEFRERFFREAKAAGRLNHPGIVTVFDVSEHEGTPFLVMEFVPGRTLQSILQSGERLDMDAVCDLGIQLAEALHYAHRNGVIHRDIKPANVLITADNRAKIADFGVAKLLESQVTATSQLLGTPAYMAPEQFTGVPVDGRADLFAMGVVLYWMATGDKPFTGDTILAVQYKVVHTDPVPPRKLNPTIPQTLEAVITKCLAKDPSQRHQSGEELARDLRGCRAGRLTVSHVQPAAVISGDDPTIVTGRAVDPPKQEGRRIFVAVLLMSLGALFAIGLVRFLRNNAPPPADTAGPPPQFETGPQPRGEIPEQPPPVPPGPPRSGARNAIVGGQSEIKTTPPEAAPGVEQFQAVPPTRGEPPVDLDGPARGRGTVIGSPARQKELAQSRAASRLLITSPSMPEVVTLIVRVDDELLYRRNPTISLPAPQESGRRGRQQPFPVPTIPLSEERLLPPGNHKIQVLVSLARRPGQVQELNATLQSGERHTLEIQFFPDAPRGSNAEGEPNRFRATLK